MLASICIRIGLFCFCKTSCTLFCRQSTMLLQSQKEHKNCIFFFYLQRFICKRRQVFICDFIKFSALCPSRWKNSVSIAHTHTYTHSIRIIRKNRTFCTAYKQNHWINGHKCYFTILFPFFFLTFYDFMYYVKDRFLMAMLYYNFFCFSFVFFIFCFRFSSHNFHRFVFDNILDLNLFFIFTYYVFVSLPSFLVFLPIINIYARKSQKQHFYLEFNVYWYLNWEYIACVSHA